MLPSMACRIFLLLFLCVLSAAVTAHAQELVVIADMDDTLKVSGVRAHSKPVERLLLHTKQMSFVGSSEILKELSHHGPLYYVSAGWDLTSGFYYDFLIKNKFPVGEVKLRSNLFESTRNYKLRTIQNIMEQHPNAQFILIGDNGQYDASVYDLLRQSTKFGPRILGAYVRSVYDSDALQPVSGRTQLFFSDLELAIYLSQQKLLPQRLVLDIADATRLEMAKISPEKLKPWFAQIAEADVARITRLASAVQETEVRDTLRKLAEFLRSEDVGDDKHLVSCASLFSKVRSF